MFLSVFSSSLPVINSNSSIFLSLPFVIKLLMQMIAANSGIRITTADNSFIRRHFWQLQLFHQTVHSFDTDIYANSP